MINYDFPLRPACRQEVGSALAIGIEKSNLINLISVICGSKESISLDADHFTAKNV